MSGITKAETPESTLKAFLLYQDMAEELLNERDSHIADQINLTLEEGETGIAFFGAAHSITDKVNKDIDIIVIQMFTDNISLKLMNKG